MRFYTMASMTPLSITKQPFKFVEVPLLKFTEEVIPHHQRIYESYRTSIHKLIAVNNAEVLSKEIKDKKRTVKQLRDLLYELETLRTQVEDSDLDKFDSKTVSLRKIILGLIKGYKDLELAAQRVLPAKTADCEPKTAENNPFYGTAQLQIEDDINEIKLKEKEETLIRVEDLTKDVEELHEIYQNLNEMVHDQAEIVDKIEENVESASDNVNSGLKSIKTAHRLKQVAYPATGALIGGIIGGPVGLFAGLKVGGIAALGCALAGYTGGKYMKKFNDPDNIDNENSQNENELNESEETGKKDI